LGAGIFITGGCSLLSGIDHLAAEIFEIPANPDAHAQAAWGVTVRSGKSPFSLLQLLGQVRASDAHRPAGARIWPDSGKLFQRKNDENHIAG